MNKLMNENADKTNACIDPLMVEESSEALEEKKQKWIDIFYQHPEMADAIINVFENRTEKNFITFEDLIKAIASLTLC